MAEYQIIKKNVAEIIPYEANPRKNEAAVAFVANSLKTFGFINPIVIDSENVIVAGHTRYKAALSLGMDEVPCICVDDLTPQQIRAFRLVDNKTAEIATWDETLEAQEMQALADDFDWSEFGWEFSDVTSLENKEIKEDEQPEIDEKKDPVVKPGEIWLLGKHRLMCGSSSDRNDVNKLMAGKKADCVFTSPPYNGNNELSDGDIFENKNNKKLYTEGYSDNLSSADYIQFCKDVLDICFENTDGFIFWNVNYNANSRFEYIAQIQYKLEYLIEQIAWCKSSAIPLKNTMRRAWEPIYLFSTNKKSPIYDQVESNKWDISNTNVQLNIHKACYPVALPAKGISLVKPKTNIVFDPFGGSGTTLIAAEQLGRTCFMMELDPRYCDVIIKRWEDYTGQQAALLN